MGRGKIKQIEQKKDRKFQKKRNINKESKQSFGKLNEKAKGI